jgi:hypothetical protein
LAELSVAPIAGGADLTAFIRVAHGLQGGDACFVPPLIVERREALDPGKNPYFRHAEARLWLARRGGRAVGRISAQIDRLHLEKYGDATGHFGLIEGADEDVFRALTAAAEAWLAGRGMKRVLGPFNLSINEESGLLVEGFDTPPMVMMGHAPPSYGRYLEACGYAKAKDLLAYVYDLAQPLPEAVRRIVERDSGRITVRALDPRTYARDVGAALALYNEAWAGNWGALPLTAEEMAHMAKAMKPLIDPALVALVELDGRLAGFAVALPNLNAAIADLGGRLLPFGWLKLVWRLKVRGVTSLRVPLMGVRPDLAGSMAGAAVAFLAIDAVRRRASAKGYTRAELSWLLEDNMPVRHMVESVGGRVYRTYRIYAKALA